MVNLEVAICDFRAEKHELDARFEVARLRPQTWDFY
jgi:hypothetical protein